MYTVLNALSEYTFYISTNITSYTFLIVFKIVESLQCILKCSKNIAGRTLHMQIIRDIFNATEKMLSSGKEFYFYLIPTPSKSVLWSF